MSVGHKRSLTSVLKVNLEKKKKKSIYSKNNKNKHFIILKLIKKKIKLLKEEFNVDVDELWKRICKIINLTFISA